MLDKNKRNLENELPGPGPPRGMLSQGRGPVSETGSCLRDGVLSQRRGFVLETGSCLRDGVLSPFAKHGAKRMEDEPSKRRKVTVGAGVFQIPGGSSHSPCLRGGALTWAAKGPPLFEKSDPHVGWEPLF